jgi:hypothetical protein
MQAKLWVTNLRFQDKKLSFGCNTTNLIKAKPIWLINVATLPKQRPKCHNNVL